ncbi:MAG: hypothetical protein E7463_09170 [Ruminococcaceae bacterium]|nr:hypothetical protein [Oscillospiraceae bacterium]
MFYFEQFSDEYFRVINQAGVKQARPVEEGNENYNACWDGACAPDGTFYTTLSSEGGKSDHAKLVRYDRETDALVECFYGGDILLPNIRQLPHSKLHTSINFIPNGPNPEDYLVIATTHSTDKTPFHSEWMPFGHHNHVWEGFPGSQILVYDPKTGKSESWGTPVPHESIYGACYDPGHHRLYMIGFMRGHVYSFDCKTRRVTKDLGKAAELFCFRLALGADGNIYGCTKSGFPFMVDTERNCLVDLGFELPEYYSPEGVGRKTHNTWYRYLSQAENTPDGKGLYMFHPYAYDLFHLDFATKKITSKGYLLPWKDGEQVSDLVRPKSGDPYTGFNCMTLDKDGVMWYVIRSVCANSKLNIKYTFTQYLCRWDLPNGGHPEVLGMIGTPDYVHNRSTELAYDHFRDILYCVNVGHGFGAAGPDVVKIDLGEFRKHMYEPGPITTHQKYFPVDMTPEEIEARDRRLKSSAGEEVTENNPFQAFPIADAFPIRLWRHIGKPGEVCDHIEDSKVIGMAFDDEDVLHVLTGDHEGFCAEGNFDAGKYVFRIKDRELLDRRCVGELDDAYKAWLKASILPQPVSFPADVKLPEATGRRYRAKASAVAQWHDGRRFVGTMDALCALVSEDGKVYSLGNAAAYGPVRCVCTNAAKTELWGVAGDVEDMGYVFHYDDKTGLRQLGIINYNSTGYYRPTAANVLSSIVLNHAEDKLAIGCIDRIATVHMIDLKK